MIDWVHELCLLWGDERGRIDNGTTYPKSIWGRIKDGWSIAAAKGSRPEGGPEFMAPPALSISVAIRHAIEAKQLTERQFQVLYVHYVERECTKRKIDALKLSKKRYYDILHRAHRVLRRNLPVENSVGDKIPETPEALRATG